jgi:septin family protein
MKRLGTRVNLIPVIAKADTLTQSDLFTFKQRVRPCLYLTLPYMQPNVSTWYL